MREIEVLLMYGVVSRSGSVDNRLGRRFVFQAGYTRFPCMSPTITRNGASRLHNQRLKCAVPKFHVVGCHGLPGTTVCVELRPRLCMLEVENNVAR